MNYINSPCTVPTRSVRVEEQRHLPAYRLKHSGRTTNTGGSTSPKVYPGELPSPCTRSVNSDKKTRLNSGPRTMKIPSSTHHRNSGPTTPRNTFTTNAFASSRFAEPGKADRCGALGTRSRPTNPAQQNPLELRPKNPETPFMNPPSELGPNHATKPLTTSAFAGRTRQG